MACCVSLPSRHRRSFLGPRTGPVSGPGSGSGLVGTSGLYGVVCVGRPFKALTRRSSCLAPVVNCMTKKPRIVLDRPQMVDRRTGECPSYDQLPLEMLHLAAIPDAERYEVIILDAGVYDAVCMGQGEITFIDYIHAVEAGVDLESVKGLALWRDGQRHRTPPQPIVGWEVLKRAAWHRMDPEPYRIRQLAPGAHRSTNHMPTPPRIVAQGRDSYFGITYFSSFGCPEACIFCCSPMVTNQRWKAMPADMMLDDLEELQDRWGFESVRFHDANWGVHEMRVHEICQGMVDRKLDFSWNTNLQVYSTLRYDKSTLDLFKETNMYCALIGAQAAEEDMLKRIGKPVKPGDAKLACKDYFDRGIIVSLTYIIGYPDETAHSMKTSLTEAADIVYSSCFHGMVRPKRGLIERISGWRLKSGNSTLPIELKIFYALDKLLGGRARREDEKQSWIQSSVHSGVDEYDDAHPLMRRSRADDPSVSG
jgi:hypothetical protein